MGEMSPHPTEAAWAGLQQEKLVAMSCDLYLTSTSPYLLATSPRLVETRHFCPTASVPNPTRAPPVSPTSRVCLGGGGDTHDTYVEGSHFISSLL